MLAHRTDNMIVTCVDPRGDLRIAKAIADVLNENWVEGYPEDKPLLIRAKHADGTTVEYLARITEKT